MSIIVATKDRPEMLRTCVESLLACRHDSFEVIIVDQSEQAASLPDDQRISVIQTPTTGKSTGLNLGLVAARGALLAFTDDDCTVPVDWLDRGTAVLARHPDVDLVFGDVEPVDHDVTAVFVPTVSLGRFHVVSAPHRAHIRGGGGGAGSRRAPQRCSTSSLRSGAATTSMSPTSPASAAFDRGTTMRRKPKARAAAATGRIPFV